MKRFTEKISEGEVDFPSGLGYTKTTDGFILNTASGNEFFKNELQTKILGWGIFFLAIGFFLSIIFQRRYGRGPDEIDFSLLPLYPMAIGGILLAIYFFITKIKADFIVSKSGIEIKSKKNSLFIDRDNISNIYASKVIRTVRGRNSNASYTYYKVILVSKEYIKLPNCDICKNKFDLFYAHELYSEESAIFLVQEFIKVLELNLNVILMGDENYAKIESNNSQFESQDFTSDFTSDLEEPKNVDFVNLEVIKNVDSELIVKKKPKYSVIVFLLAFFSILLIFAIYILFNKIFFEINQDNLVLSYFILGGLSIISMLLAISLVHSGRGFSISINSYSIEKSTIFLLGLNFIKPYHIRIGKDVRAKLHETIVSQYNPENISFGVVLKSKSNEFPAILLITGISVDEAKYIIWKINNFVSKNNY